jgi:hypothetical protein
MGTVVRGVTTVARADITDETQGRVIYKTTIRNTDNSTCGSNAQPLYPYLTTLYYEV